MRAPRSQSLPELIRIGALHIAALARGRAPALGVSRGEFARALVEALRPHFFAFPAAAVLAGAAAIPGQGLGWRPLVAASAAGLAWGIGQLLNDLHDLEADAVDAPQRPLLGASLPEAPTAAVGLALGACVTIALSSVHSAGIGLTALSAALLFVYGRAKALPLAGNVAHGLLISTLTLLGVAAARPSGSLVELAGRAWPLLVVTGGIAAVYLQANYEKDRVGDAHAGYRTLAHVLGIRASAGTRAVAGAVLGVGALGSGLLPDVGSRALMVGAGALLTLSVAPSLARGDEAGALAGYRFAIHATTLALLALAEPRVGLLPSLVLFAIAAALVERAFARARNP